MTAYFSLQQGKNKWLKNLLKTKHDELTGVNRKFTPYWKSPAYLLRKYRRKHPPRLLLTPKQTQQGKAIEQPSTEREIYLSPRELDTVIDIIEAAPIPTSEKKGLFSTLWTDYITTPKKRLKEGMDWYFKKQPETPYRATKKPPLPYIPNYPKLMFKITTPHPQKEYIPTAIREPFFKSHINPQEEEIKKTKKPKPSMQESFWNSPTQKFYLNEIIKGRRKPLAYQVEYLNTQGFYYNKLWKKWAKKK